MSKNEIKIFKRISWKVGGLTKETIENYEVGKCITSPVFEIPHEDGATKWRVGIYPNGQRSESKSHIGGYLCSVELNPMLLNVAFKFGISSEGEVEIILLSNETRTREEFIAGLGWHEIISHEKLFDPANKYWKDDSFTFVVELELTMQGKLGNISEVKNPVAPMYNDAIMCKDKLFTDIELKANDGKVLEAHKVILATRSPLLFEMLLKDMQETQNDVANVKNFNSKIMTEVLLFIYCGNVKNLDGVARDLIHAAELYQMKELKKICIESIESTLSAENVLKTLVIANRFSETGKLFNKCLDVIMREHRFVCQTKEWSHLPRELFIKITNEALSRSNTINI